MINVFLSASVPLPQRDRRFFETADILGIREAVKALVEVVLPIGSITCGGHPAITPLLALFVCEAGLGADGVTIYQSAFFAGQTPPEITDFVNVRVVPAVGNDRGASLTAMREEMVASRHFAAAVIIGGMEGVFEELDLFVRHNPTAAVLPLASTGAAAAVIHQKGNYDKQLARDLTFPSLFRRRLLPLRDTWSPKTYPGIRRYLMSKVFISYRRAEAPAFTARLYDHLELAFGEKALFRDIDNILAGKNADEQLKSALKECAVLIVIIGEGWFEAISASGSTIHDEIDYVHMEIAKALELKIPIVPVLLYPASMPPRDKLPTQLRALAAYQAAIIRPEHGFDSDIRLLIERISAVANIDHVRYWQLIEDCRAIGLVTIKSSFDKDQTVLEEIQTTKDLLVVMNDGRSWVDTKRELLAQRATDLNKTTRIVLLHPESDFMHVLIRKNKKSLDVQRAEIKRSHDTLKSYKWHAGCFDLRGHHGFNPYSLILTDTYTFVSTYFFNESGQLPLFRYSRLAPNGLYHSIRDDAERLFNGAHPISDEHF